MNHKHLIFSLILGFFCLSLPAQQLIPPIHNFSAVTYGAASQNWDISIDSIGNIFAANNQGLLQYDGQRWELFPLSGAAVIRSVFPYKGKIFTGAYKEFGFWERDEKGNMRYTSLINKLEEPLESEEFWEILEFKGNIYFRSFGAIYKYDQEDVQRIKGVATNKMIIYQDRLLLSVGKQGLCFLFEDGRMEPLKNQDLLAGKRVLDMEVDGQEILIGTREELYRYDGVEVKPFGDEDLQRKLREFEFNHLMKIGKKDLLLATVRNGIIHYNLKTGRSLIYNRKNGLQNNTVLGMAERNGVVWLGLDNGIDKIYLDSPIKFYTDLSGELGAVYGLKSYKKKLYLASNTGVYSYGKSNGLNMLENAQGHSWALKVIDNELFVNHNSGTYKVLQEQLVPLDSRTGSFTMIKTPQYNKYGIGTYTGISIYNPETGNLHNVDGLNFPVKKMVFEDPQTVWLEHPNEGLFRVGLTKDYSKTTFIQKIDDPEEKMLHKSKVFLLDGQVSVLKNKKWYRYNKFRDILEEFDELADFEDNILLFEDKEGYWFANRNNHSVTFTNFDNTQIKLSYRDLNNRNVKDNESLLKVQDSVYYLTLNDGFACLDLKEMIRLNRNDSLAPPIITRVFDHAKSYDLRKSPSVPFNNAQDLRVQVSTPGNDDAVIQYILNGERRISGEAENGRLHFQNLARGDYELQVSSSDSHGHQSDMSTLNFTVEAPWYFSLPMQFFYFLLILGLFTLFVLWNKEKLNKHRRILEERMEKEHREKMEKLEKKRLQDEIMLKRKELANTTLMAAKKNEVLMDIQGELNKDKDKFSNQYRLKHIMTKINSAIKSKAEWQVFETNFKEVHEDFSRELLKKFPELTAKDLKLCSYLKMNLTSKEIAPLMGKSLRGVEVHRYRLRKKLNLDSEVSLSNFLIKNF